MNTTFFIPRGLIPQNSSSLRFAISEELGNKQTNTHTNSLTEHSIAFIVTSGFSATKLEGALDML